ncbi:hypothetical protein [Mycolicibacterium mageritense]|uniref:hypothetical protein n=1 Tax=Mycolicibacterium mageritense TaxID=53462 RepID=UPI001E35D87F|nr:hypothetical protein [Mycolicibacterium mageritense]GJJ23761.1 hypothetical protein MTY414_74350 [Mycolicibacterium mageritense]
MPTASPPPQSAAISAAEVTAFLERADLDPGQWNIAEITRKANNWVTINRTELAQIDPQWSTEDKTAHYAEFGAVSAVDFVEQCVIEAGPDTAPWRELQIRADAGEFQDWPPVWRATVAHDLSPRQPGHPSRSNASRALERVARIRTAHQRAAARQREQINHRSIEGVDL